MQRLNERDVDNQPAVAKLRKGFYVPVSPKIWCKILTS